MNCPKCDGVSLNQETIEDIAIDRCTDCHGIWLDELELEKLVQAKPRTLLAEDRHFKAVTDTSGPRLNCPRCQGTHLIKLNSRLRPGTILDSCTVCYGTWLDAGELARLAHADLLGRIRSFFVDTSGGGMSMR